MLNITAKTSKPTKPVLIKTSELIKHRYSFFMSLLKSYVRYSQMVENKSKSQVSDSVDTMIDDLVSKYSLGSQFAYDIKSFINKQYMISHNQMFDEFKHDSNLPDDVFNTLLASFVDNNSHENLYKTIGPRFMSILR